MDSDTYHSIEVTVEAPAWRAIVTDPEVFCGRIAGAVLRDLWTDDLARPVDEPAGPVPQTEAPIELSIVLTDDAAIRDLNRRWRGFDKATNVLSFPSGVDETMVPAGAPRLLGDVVVGLETVLREAADAGRPATAHLAHLLVHGVLHLLGFDHEAEADALRMERLEIELLAHLDIANPYAEIVS
jgi:probable rRNA maturation factor